MAAVTEDKTLRVLVRWLVERDMPEVLACEGQSFEFPWSEQDFIQALRRRNCIGMAAEYQDRVVGFMVYELHKTHLHVLGLAVDHTFRHRGIGGQMVAKLVSKLSSIRRRLVLEVRETNLPALLFFKRCGFKAICVLHNHYDETVDDAYRMVYRLPAKKE